jgi:hypothetical protein
MERRRHRSGGPRPDITAKPLDLSGLYPLPADADAILGETPRSPWWPVRSAVSSAHASVLRVPGEETRVHRLLPLGIDDPTGSPSGRTRGRDTCTSIPERSHSGSLLCVPGSGREPRRRRTSGAHLGAASSRPQARRSVNDRCTQTAFEGDSANAIVASPPFGGLRAVGGQSDRAEKKGPALTRAGPAPTRTACTPQLRATRVTP